MGTPYAKPDDDPKPFTERLWALHPTLDTNEKRYVALHAEVCAQISSELKKPCEVTDIFKGILRSIATEERVISVRCPRRTGKTTFLKALRLALTRMGPLDASIRMHTGAAIGDGRVDVVLADDSQLGFIKSTSTLVVTVETPTYTVHKHAE